MLTLRLPGICPRLLTIILLITLAACSSDDSPTGPGPDGGVARLDIQVPTVIRSDEAFELRIVAVDANGVGPVQSFSGTVDLAVSIGTVTPSSISVDAGEGTASVVVQTSASSVELSVTHASATGKVEVNCAKPASVLVTSGRFHLSAGASAHTQSESQNDGEIQNEAIPATMSFSRSMTFEVKATHPVTNSEQILTARATVDVELIATSQLADGGRLRSMTILSSGSAFAAFDGDVGQGSASSSPAALVEFNFTVENAPLLVEVDGTFEKASFVLKNGDGATVLALFGEHSAVISPGDYSFITRLNSDGASSPGLVHPVDTETVSMDVHLSFTETVSR